MIPSVWIGVTRSSHIDRFESPVLDYGGECMVLENMDADTSAEVPCCHQQLHEGAPMSLLQSVPL